MKQKIKISIICSISLILMTTSIWAKNVKAVFNEKPVRIDGKTDDWPGVKLYKDYGGRIQYSLRMDQKDLYILFKINKNKFISTLFSNGIKIWFNQKNQKNKYGINFVSKTISSERFVQLLEKKYGILPQEKKKQIYRNKSYVLHQSIIIKGNNREFVPVNLNVKETSSFKIAGTKKEQVVIEFKIPHALQKKLLNVVNIQKEIQLVLEWGGMTDAIKKRRLKRVKKMNGDMGGSMSSGMSGGMSGGSMGGSMGGSRDPRPKYKTIDPKKYSIKLKLTLPIDKIKRIIKK